MRIIAVIIAAVAIYYFTAAIASADTAEDWQQLRQDIEVLPEACPDFLGNPREIDDREVSLIIRQARIYAIQFESFGLPSDRVKELAGAAAFYTAYKQLCMIF